MFHCSDESKDVTWRSELVVKTPGVAAVGGGVAIWWLLDATTYTGFNDKYALLFKSVNKVYKGKFPCNASIQIP